MHGYNIIPHTLRHEEWCTQMEVARSFFWRELDTRKGKKKREKNMKATLSRLAVKSSKSTIPYPS